jgi:Asparagine synthase
VYFTLAISARTASACASLISSALAAPPEVMPIPGRPVVAWRAPDQRAAVLTWGPASASGAIQVESAGVLHGRASLCRVDPVYVAERPAAIVLSDRSSWAAAVAGTLRSPDPVMCAALLNLGFPLGNVTPYRGVYALGSAEEITVTAGVPQRRRTAGAGVPQPRRIALAGADPASVAAGALTEAVAPLADSAIPVEISLTGGKDSRLIAAALTAAKVPFRARTYGGPDHPDVVVAAQIAAHLGVEHVVTPPSPPGTATPESVLIRLRNAVLVSDGMLSAFENLGRPDPPFNGEVIHVGGHGGELLRGGYATYSRNPARGALQFRRLTTGRLGLLRPAAAAAYASALAPWAARFARGPLRALDDFYLVNRAGRWSAAARQAYLLRENLVQPFFAESVVRAARQVPLRDRISGALHQRLIATLCPDLAGIPLAGRAPAPASADWRRALTGDLADFFRGYILDHGAPVFELVSRPAAEKALRTCRDDPEATWSLATLTCHLSGDWLNARQ